MFNLKEIQKYILKKFSNELDFNKIKDLSESEFACLAENVIFILDSLFEDKEYLKLRYNSNDVNFNNIICHNYLPIDIKNILISQSRIEPLIFLILYLYQNKEFCEFISLFERLYNLILKDFTESCYLNFPNIILRAEIAEKRYQESLSKTRELNLPVIKVF